LPRPELSEQWHGVYLKHPTRTELLLEPEPGVTIVNGLGGGGMTLSFGLAEDLAARQGW
jgi:glycine/D-amino acid oxidase-like deaminating enzyme